MDPADGGEDILHRRAGGCKAGRRDDVVGALALLGIGKLAREDQLEVGFRHPAGEDAVALNLARDGDDGDGVTGFVEADLVQEGHVEEDDLGTLVRRKEIGPILGDKRVDGRVDPIKRGGVGLDDLAQAGATDGAVFNGVRE